MLITPALPAMVSWFFFLAPSIAVIADVGAPSPRPLVNAHAHNDYLHPRPLLDALAEGFCSVEADIYLVDGELLVAHDPIELVKRRRLEDLYLKPLRERIRANGGRVFKDGPEFSLLIDLKSDGKTTYEALTKLLERYQDMLSVVRDGKVEKGAVTVVLSGDRDWKRIEADKTRYAGVDGRLGDLNSDRPAHLMPLISDRWGAHFRWTGDGPQPEVEKQRLKDIVDQAHARGRRVRFWATPENKAVWKVLRDAGVDLINTDKLKELRSFLEAQRQA